MKCQCVLSKTKNLKILFIVELLINHSLALRRNWCAADKSALIKPARNILET